MKVLHLTTHLNTGGITRYILQLVKPLKALGIETHIASSGGECAEDFKAAGATLHAIDIKVKSFLHPKVFGAVPKVKKIIQDQNIDLVHAHTRVTQSLAHFARKKTAAPVTSTCHGYFKNRLGRRLLPAWGDKVIAISEPVAENLQESFSVPKEQISVINNGIDIESLTSRLESADRSLLRKKHGHPDDAIIFCNTSRLVFDKGHHHLIQAFSTLKQQNENIRLIIVGDGPELENLQRLAQKLGCQDDVYFTGRVTDVFEYLAISDIFAFPPLWREGFGLSIAEAMALRLPIITTKIDALQSMISDRNTGLLVTPNDVNALYDAMLELLQNAELRAMLGENGRGLAEAEYGLPRMANEIKSHYESLL